VQRDRNNSEEVWTKVITPFSLVEVGLSLGGTLPPLLRWKSKIKKKLKTPWSEFASELYGPSDRRLSAKLLPNFADRGCQVVSVTDPYGRIISF
jgi:hypothetical protein